VTRLFIGISFPRLSAGPRHFRHGRLRRGFLERSAAPVLVRRSLRRRAVFARQSAKPRPSPLCFFCSFRDLPLACLASVINLLQRDPDREDERCDNADKHPRISGPFPTRHFVDPHAAELIRHRERIVPGRRAKAPPGGHCLFRPPSSTAGDIADRSLSIKPLQARINGKALRFNATAISTAVPPASSISESRLSSPDIQRLAGRLKVQPAPEHEACSRRRD
jgi:hypothetical protein